MITHKQAVAFMEKHGDEISELYHTFTDAGCCEHDLPLVGLVAMLRKWEHIRTDVMKRDLEQIEKGGQLADS